MEVPTQTFTGSAQIFPWARTGTAQKDPSDTQLPTQNVPYTLILRIILLLFSYRAMATICTKSSHIASQERCWLGNTLVALLHGSAVEPGEAIERFQQDTFGVGEAQLIRARNNSEKPPNPK